MDDRIDPTMFADDEDRFAIGQPVPRSEDPVLLRGEGKYSDDWNLPGQAYCWIVRSPYAHGRDPRDRHRGGARDAGGAGGLYGGGPAKPAASGRCRRGRS